MHVLVVEDDARLAEALARILEDNGYTTDVVHDGEAGVRYGETGTYDVIILDVMLPKADGFTVAQRLRRAHVSTPILLLTARDAISDKICGYDSGADDYITKPFGVMELISRVKALLRRIDRVKKEDLNYGTIRIDVSRHTVQVDGNEVELTYKEYEILKYLMKNRGIVLTRDSLMEKIWGYDFEHGNRTVDVHIQSLRKKLGTAGDAIKTIRNVGYKIGD